MQQGQELRRRDTTEAFCILPHRTLGKLNLVLFELFQADSERSALESPKAWKIPALLFVVFFKFMLFGSPGFFFSLKILQLQLQQLLPGNQHKWEHFEPMKHTVYSSCLVPKYHNHENSIK